jgi:hypothetical protein
VTRVVEAPNSVVLLVGRQQFTPPSSFADNTAVATDDCIAVGIMSVHDGPTTVTVVPATHTSALIRLGELIPAIGGLRFGA